MPRPPRPRQNEFTQNYKTQRGVRNIYQDPEPLFEEEPYSEVYEPEYISDYPYGDDELQVVPYQSQDTVQPYYDPDPYRRHKLRSRSQTIDESYNPLVDEARRAVGYRSNDEYLRDPVTGRYRTMNVRGDPNDPNYFWDPYNRRTNRRIKANYATDLYYNRLGLGHTSLEEEPLTVQESILKEASAPPVQPFVQPRGVEDEYFLQGAEASNLERAVHEGMQRVINEGKLASRMYENDEVFSHAYTDLRKPQQEASSQILKFSNTEYVQDIKTLSTGAFSLNTFIINPGLWTVFPTLAQIAGNFTYYRFTKLKFRYVSTSSDPTTTTNVSSGLVVMACNENVSTTDPLNLQTIINIAGAKTFKPSITQEYEFDCSTGISKNFYVRTNPTVISGAQQLTDYLKFYISTSGLGSSITVGSLFIDYSVELWDLFLYSSVYGQNIMYYRTAIQGFTSSWDPSVNGMFPGTSGIPVLVNPHGNMAMTLTSDMTSNTWAILKFPTSLQIGFFRVQMYFAHNTTWGSGGSGTVPAIPFSFVTAGCSLIYPHARNNGNVCDNLQVEYSNGQNGGTTNVQNVYDITSGGWVSQICISFYLQITASPAQLSITGASAPAISTLYSGTFSIEQMNPNFQYDWKANAGGVALP